MSHRSLSPMVAVCALAAVLAAATALYARESVGARVVRQQEIPCVPEIAVSEALPSDRCGIPGLPPDEKLNAVNRFAWESFIALNWPASELPYPCDQSDATAAMDDPPVPVTFGQPGDCAPVVWLTYKLIDDVFRADGADPGPWETSPDLPPACVESLHTWRARTHSILPDPEMLRLFSKIRPDFHGLDELAQVGGALLVDQKQRYVRYDSRINKESFDYIVSNQLYEANHQLAFATKHLIDQPLGTILMKAAWRELDESDDRSRYKTVLFLLTDPVDGTCTEPTVMGLVGLHVVRKTSLMWQMMWATFEHVDNAPEIGQNIDPSQTFSFFDSECDICILNTEPPSKTPVPTPARVQVRREQTIPQPIHDINAAARAAIVEEHPGSVWQHYQLVNASWPNNGQKLSGTPTAAPVPLELFQFLSTEGRKTNNVTLETYQQSKDCMDCHRNADIALNVPTPYAADFSFMFGKAKPAATPTSTPIADAPP
jgi:hypothetical protein